MVCSRLSNIAGVTDVSASTREIEVQRLSDAPALIVSKAGTSTSREADEARRGRPVHQQREAGCGRPDARDSARRRSRG